MIMWNLAVITFNAQIQVSTGDETTVFVSKKAVAKYKAAIDEHVRYAQQLLAFPKLPKEKLLPALQEMSGKLNGVIGSLKWDLDALVAEAKAINLGNIADAED